MPNAHAILDRKADTSVATLPPDATVLDAARLMNDRRIGSVLVVEDDRVVGIFTERDVLVRVVAAKRDPATTNLIDVMTTPVACATPNTRTDELRSVMREKRIRHIPVVDDGRLLGIVSIGDVNQVDSDVQAETIRYLEQYMSRA